MLKGYKEIHGFNWYYGKGSQNELIPIANKKNKIVVKQVNRDYQLWTIMTPEQLEDLVKKTTTFVCEILSSYPKKVYFDIDCTKKDNEEYFEKFNIQDYIDELNGLFEDGDLAISGSEEDDKKSYHIAVNNYLLHDYKDMEKLKLLVIELIEDGFIAFDKSVYTKNRPMKCIGQRKEPNRAIQEITYNSDPRKHFIGCFFNKKTFQFDYVPKEDLTKNNYDGCKTQKIIKLKGEFAVTPISRNFEDINIIDLLEPETLLAITPFPINQDHSYTWRVFLFCVYNDISFDMFWSWASTKGINRYDKYLKYWNDEKTNKTNEMYKISIKGYLGFLSDFYPTLKNCSTVDDIITNTFMESLKVRDVCLIENRIENKHYETDHKVVCFNIGMGGGKTTGTIKYIKDTKKNFVWITPRVTLAENTKGAFTRAEVDVLMYKTIGKTADKAEAYAKANNLIIQAESLHYLDKNYSKDVLIIDEFETVLNSWVADTHKVNLERNWLNFIRMFKNCKKVILLDAFFSNKTFNFLNKLGLNNYIVYEAKYKPISKQVDMIESNDMDYTVLIEKCAKEINEGKKLYIYYPYKNASKFRDSIYGVKRQLEGLCKDKKFCEPHTGDSTKEQKSKLANVNNYWSQYDCVLANGAITVGVNFDIEHFDKVVMFASSYCNLPRDLIQASMRIRNLKDTQLTFYMFDQDSKKTFENPDYYFSGDVIYKKLVDDIKIENMADWLTSFKQFCELSNYDIGLKKPSFFEKSGASQIETVRNAISVDYDYDLLDELNETELDELQTKIERETLTVEDTIKIKKFFFDKKYKNLNRADRSYIWNYNLEYTFDNLKCDISEYIAKDNNAKDLRDVNFNNLKMSETTSKFIHDKYNCILKSPIQRAVKTLNSALRRTIVDGRMDKSKNVKYTLTNKIIELYSIYDSIQPINNNICLINTTQYIKEKEL